MASYFSPSIAKKYGTKRGLSLSDSLVSAEQTAGKKKSTNGREGRAGEEEDGEEDEEEDPMMLLQWYHPHLTRHAADCMLIDNAPEGSYLLRASSDFPANATYVLSVKLSSSVQHIKVPLLEGSYKFGNSSFRSVEGLKRHFEVERPVIGGDSGVTVVLRFPYMRFVSERHIYTDVVHHAVTNLIDDSDDSDDSDQGDQPPPPPPPPADAGGAVQLQEVLTLRGQASIASSATSSSSSSRGGIGMGGGLTLPLPQAISSKEGFLTKQGKIRKNWKCRWFVLRSNTLSYYKTKQSRQPICRLDLSRATAVEYDNSKHKNYCFRVEFPHRTYFIYASCAEDCDHWVELLRSRLSVIVGRDASSV